MAAILQGSSRDLHSTRHLNSPPILFYPKAIMPLRHIVDLHAYSVDF